MIGPRAAALAGALAVLAAAGCGGSKDAPGCPGVARPYAGQLLYPIPGASGVPVSAGSLVLSGVPGSEFVSVVGPDGAVVMAKPGPAPSPLPEPIATPSQPGARSGLAYPPLASDTTYEVTYVGSAGLTCYLPVGGSLGTFTTR